MPKSGHEAAAEKTRIVGLSESHQLSNEVVTRLSVSPMLVVGRNSGDSGSQPYQAAAQDLHEAFEMLASLGLELRQILPGKDELVAMLRAAEPERAIEKDTGKSFSNRFVELDHRRSHNVVILLSAGTATKIRASDGEQPFGHRLGQTIWRYQTPVMVGKRVDRWARKAWHLAPAAGKVEALDGLVGDSIRGFRRVDGPDGMMLFFDAASSQANAKDLPRQARVGMTSRTDTRMENGRARIGVSHPVPPGLGRVRLATGDGQSAGAGLLYIDGCGCQPTPDEVAYGLPRIFDDDGEPVDQVKTVRWVLSVLGRPEWPMHRIAERLAAARFSSVGIRRVLGANAVYQLPSDRLEARRVKRSFLHNLEFYRTGVLPLRLGTDGVADIAIENCFPPDGPWLTEEDYQRISQWAGKPAHRDGAMTLTGLPATLNGKTDVCLAPVGQDRGEDAPKYTRYDMALAETFREIPRRAAEGSRALPHRQFVDSIIDALAAVDQRALTVFAIDEDADAAARLETEVADAATKVRRLQAEADRLTEQVLRAGGDSTPLTGAFLERINERYNDIVEREIPEWQDAHRQRSRQLDDLRRPTRRPNDVTVLPRIVARLRDPVDSTMRATLHEVLRDVAFTTTDRWIQDMLIKHIAWTGKVVLTSGDAQISVPFSGEFAYGKGTEIAQRVDRLVDAVIAGTPLALVDAPRKDTMRKQAGQRLAQRLDIDRHTALTLLCIDDPRCLAAALAAGTETTATPAGEPIDSRLIERAKLMLAASPNIVRWRHTARKDAHLCYLGAAQQDGTLLACQPPDGVENYIVTRAWLLKGRCRQDWDDSVRGQLTMRPCAWCGSTRRLPLTLLEPDTSVCLDCRRDRAGLDWPADPYDRYTLGIEAFAEAGLITAPKPRVKTKGRPRTLRQPADFTDEQRQQILADYTADTMPLDGADGLLDRHGIKSAELYRLLDLTGTPTRRAVKRNAIDAWHDEVTGEDPARE